MGEADRIAKKLTRQQAERLRGARQSASEAADRDRALILAEANELRARALSVFNETRLDRARSFGVPRTFSGGFAGQRAGWLLGRIEVPPRADQSTGSTIAVHLLSTGDIVFGEWSATAKGAWVMHRLDSIDVDKLRKIMVLMRSSISEASA